MHLYMCYWICLYFVHVSTGADICLRKTFVTHRNLTPCHHVHWIYVGNFGRNTVERGTQHGDLFAKWPSSSACDGHSTRIHAAVQQSWPSIALNRLECASNKAKSRFSFKSILRFLFSFVIQHCSFGNSITRLDPRFHRISILLYYKSKDMSIYFFFNFEFAYKRTIYGLCYAKQLNC